MRDRNALMLRLAYAGRAVRIRLGRTGLIAAAAVLSILFVLGTQLIYDFRDSRIKLRELSALRQRVSEQNLTLYNLHARFESLETEVERMRALEARANTLARTGVPLPAEGGEKEAAAGVGGAETPEGAAASRLDRLLDLRFAKLSRDILIDARNLEGLCDRLDTRRIFLESIPGIWPVRGIVSSPFGVRTSPFTETDVFHHGVDIATSPGTPVWAAAGGRVLKSCYESLLGNCVVVEHGNGYRTLYAHLSERRVQAGDPVEKGETVGTVGATGRTTGPHLHYEVRVNGLPVNPSRFLN